MPHEIEEVLCTWPNGERRRVVVMSRDGNRANIIWNERVDTGCAVVTGMDELVPTEWLSPLLEEEPST